MATSRRSTPQLIPFVIVSLVTLLFLIWAMRQCSSNDGDYAMIEEQTTRESYLEKRDSVLRDSIRKLQEAQALAQQTAGPSLSGAEEEARAREAALLRARTQPLPGDSLVYLPGQVAERVIVEKETVLYSTIDGLNVRSRPTLDAGIVARIPLYTAVTFMNEVTDSLYQIDLGEITPTEPWVRIRLEDGKTGWVYGAGVSYYKYRLPGVIN